MMILPAALVTLSLQVTPEIEHLMKLASLDSEDGGAGEIGVNEFIVDWGTSIKDYVPSIFCAKEYLDPDFDVLLNADYFELLFDADKFTSIGELPFFYSGIESGIFGIRLN